MRIDYVPIVSIERLAPADAVCIALDSADKLYVTDDGIVTHNTTVGGQQVRHVAPGALGMGATPAASSFLTSSPIGRRVADLMRRGAWERLPAAESYGVDDARRYAGDSRKIVLGAVKKMADASYARIGGHPFTGRPVEDMLEADTVFDVQFHEGKPVAFSIIKPTKEGMKSTLSGTDGSEAGRRAWKLYFDRHRAPGYYVEASGPVEGFALSKGIPKVPVGEVSRIIGKSIEEDADGLHYSREILINGLKESHKKAMFGLPWSRKNTAKQTRSPISSTSTTGSPILTKTAEQSPNSEPTSPSKSASTDAPPTRRKSAGDSTERSDPDAGGSLRIGTDRNGRDAATADRPWWDDADDEAAVLEGLDLLVNKLPTRHDLDERRRDFDKRLVERGVDPDSYAQERERAILYEAFLADKKGQSHEDWFEAAKRLVAKDPTGVARELIEAWREGNPLSSPVMVKAAQIMIPRIMEEALASGDRAQMQLALALQYADFEAGTAASYNLGARRRRYANNADKHRDILLSLISRVPSGIKAQMATAPTPADKNRKINAIQKKMEAARQEADAAQAEVAALTARIDQKQAEVDALTARIDRTQAEVDALTAGLAAGLAEIARLKKELANVKSLHNAAADRAKAEIHRLGRQLAEVRRAKDRAEILGTAHEERLKRVEAVLAGMGLTLHDIFSHQAVVRLRGSEIVARVIEDNFSAPQRAVIRFSLPPEGFSPREVAKKTGVRRDAIPGIMAKFRQRMEARFLELAKRGLTLHDFQVAEGGAMFDLRGRVGEQGQRLGMAAPVQVSDEEAARATKEIMDALFGGNPGHVRPNRVPFDLDNRVHVSQVGRAIHAEVDGNRYDAVFEYWVNNILSGPQTHAVNIVGNSLSIAAEYGLQRWLEAGWNLMVKDEKSAQFGEYKELLRMFPLAWGSALRRATVAWDAEQSFLRHDLLNESVEIVADRDDKLGGGRRAIPDRVGRVGTQGAPDLPTAIARAVRGKGWRGASVGKTVRIPGRSLLFMDELFKGVVMSMEAAAFAYRTGKANGLSGAALESHIRSEVGRPGSESWQAAAIKGEELTFTTPLKGAAEGGGVFEQWVRKLQESRGSDSTLSPMAAAIVGWFFPFIQTPFNIYKTGLRRTPFGLVGVASHLLKSGLYTRKNGGLFIENYGKARMVRDLADQTIAMIVTSILWGLTEGDDDDDDKLFLVTGSRPWGIASSGERSLADRLNGGAFSIRLGKAGPDATYIDYSRIEPAATVIASVADAIRSIKRVGNGADKADEMAKLHSYVLSQATDKTFLQGLAKIGDILEPGRSTGSAAARSVVQAIVPNMVRQPIRLLDDYERESRTAPWYYHALPMGAFAQPRMDIYGQPVRKGRTPLSGALGPMDRFARILIDIGVKPTNFRHPADLALVNWNRANPNEPYFPPRNSITSFKDMLGESHKLSAAQLAEIERRGGRRLAMLLAQQITPAEAAHPTKDTIDKIRSTRSKVFREARDAVVSRRHARPLNDIMGWSNP